MGSNNFPHDGERGCTNGRCTGYGCNCDEKNYGYRGGGHRRSGGATIIWLIIIVVASAIGAWCQLIGVLILIIGAILILANR